jgi:PBP1b-binding outer membrane lipoprotein LpoB
MKKTYTLLAIVLLSAFTTGCSQNDSLTQKEPISMPQSIAHAAPYSGPDESDLSEAKNLYNQMIETASSTTQMAQACIEPAALYAKAIEKHYTEMMQELNEEDQKILKNSQDKWLQYMQAEELLDSRAAEISGGSIERVVKACNGMEHAQRRANDLLWYNTRI